MKYKQIMNILSKDVKGVLEQENLQFDYLQEIRLRAGYPIILLYGGKEKILPMKVTERGIRETLDYVSNYSLYAYENELKQGFITIEGGHRVGMAGQVLIENGRVKNLKQISSLNVRVSHEIVGCADKLFPYITHNKQMYHTLLISPPRCGKTTLLRDLIRQISDGNEWVKGCTVGVVDERSELAGCYQGIPQNHMGMRTDVLDGCPKADGMLMLIRSMSPQVVAVDEIGAPEDIQAIKYAMHCGCKMIATVHGESLEELQRKPLLEQMMREQCFERYVLLCNRSSVGEIAGIYDKYGDEICLNG
ncbi:MAG: stage III sporulation protein AA [Tyzzerella sp.]|nr:stage III sporulation protein AA [Tyzzerella sp.]